MSDDDTIKDPANDAGTSFSDSESIVITVDPPPPPCTADVNGDGFINVLDLIDLLLCFGQPAIPGCVGEDINEDGNVNVLDLIELLLAFGDVCP